MSSAVVDASAVTALLFAEPLTPKAEALFADAQHDSRQLASPHLLPFEVTNAVRKYMRRERLQLRDALAAMDLFLALPIELFIDQDLHREALRLTERYSLGGQDAHYVALARRLGCDFWTADGRILRAVAGRLRFVRFIGDYSPLRGPSPR